MKVHMLALGVIMSVALSGCQNPNANKVLLGAAAVGAVGTAYYVGRKHEKHKSDDKSEDSYRKDDSYDPSQLVDKSLSRAERSLSHHGYYRQQQENKHGNQIAYWNNRDSHHCIKLKSRDEKVTAAQRTYGHGCS
ncbi:hypothetical protein ACEUC3_19440 [Aeromonas bivalvium]|uniref:hypothetical protein n=1 Tax=Aeromonas bivalvium TaxID=440079 RepID=UPI0038D1E6BF